MPHISLAFSAADIGIPVPEIFWVKHGIITKELLRESRDEEIICDILASMCLAEMPPANTSIFNEYFAFPVHTTRSTEIAAAVARLGEDKIEQQVMFIFDEIRRIFDHFEQTFSTLCFSDPPAQCPRYFTAFFLALHTLVFEKGRRASELSNLRNALKGVCDDLNVSTGGNWSAKNKERNQNALIGILDPFCEDLTADDPASQNWATKLENILNQSLIEQQLYDFKVGFHELSQPPAFNEGLVDEIVCTLVAMTNTGPNRTGYVLVGIADKPEDASRVESIFDVSTIERFGRRIVGIDHECTTMGLSLDELFTRIVDLVNRAPVDNAVRKDIRTRIKSVSYYGKSLFVFELPSYDKPKLYDERYYVREGTSTKKLKTSDMEWLFGTFKGHADRS